MKYKIFCIGSQWRGSDDGSLFRALARQGNLINIADDKSFIPTEISGFWSKVIRKVGTSAFLNEFNEYLVQQVKCFRPDLIFVYKGTSVFGRTLKYFKTLGIPVICVYPDTSFYDQGPHIPECIPYYDFIFTTKSFGCAELKLKSNYTNATFMLHCVDPDIHRPIPFESHRAPELACDVSFIGSYSPGKEKTLIALKENMPDLQLKLWGFGWNLSKSRIIHGMWQKQPIYGDVYALAIGQSKVNLGLLYEGSVKSRQGDLITSRSFHIPGAGGFLLHERSSEFLELFTEGKDAACFSGIRELSQKISYYLVHDAERKTMASSGHNVVMAKHTSDHRVAFILNTLREKQII